MEQGFNTLCILSWIAVIGLSASYFRQVWTIHRHKEVRDLDLLSYIGLVVFFLVLLATAIVEGSTIFIVKQILTVIPTSIIVGQILYHRNDGWKD